MQFRSDRFIYLQMYIKQCKQTSIQRKKRHSYLNRNKIYQGLYFVVEGSLIKWDCISICIFISKKCCFSYALWILKVYLKYILIVSLKVFSKTWIKRWYHALTISINWIMDNIATPIKGSEAIWKCLSVRKYSFKALQNYRWGVKPMTKMI